MMLSTTSLKNQIPSKTGRRSQAWIALGATSAASILLLLLSSGTAAAAVMIGVNFSTDRTTFANSGPISPAPAATAGMVPQQNWNEARIPATSTPIGGLSSIVGPSSGVLVDETGAPTGVGLSWNTGSGSNGIQNHGSPANPDEELFANFIEGPGTVGVPMVFSLTNVPFSSYDVYVYFADFASSDSSINIGTETFFADIGGDFGSAPSPLFVQATSTSAGSPTTDATYALFEDLTGSTFDLNVTKIAGNRATISAFQIVNAVPEPSSTALLGLGGLALMLRRRR